MGQLVSAQPRVHHLGKDLLATSVPEIAVVAREHRHYDFLFGHDEYSLVPFSGGANDVVAIVSLDPATVPHETVSIGPMAAQIKGDVLDMPLGG